MLSELRHFNLTRDLPADILHYFLLGWLKKTLQSVKKDFLDREGIDTICAILDKIVLWKEYGTRTTSNVFRTIASNIGRNIKALAQVIWYPFYLII